MSVQEPGSHSASPQDVMGVGAAFAAAGLYFLFGTAGYLPMPANDSPAVVGLCLGGAFVLAGLVGLFRGRTRPSYRTLGIGAAGALVIVGTFVAIGSGLHTGALAEFSRETAPAGDLIGRVVFALGATILCILAVGVTVQATRRLFDRAR